MSDIEQWTGQERILLAEIDRLRAELSEYRLHSVELNRLQWRLAEILGDVGPDDTTIEHDPQSVERAATEIDRLRAELTVTQERNSELLPIAAQCVRAVCHEHAVSRLERAEAAIERVRELCDHDAYEYNGRVYAFTEQILAAIDGEQT